MEFRPCIDIHNGKVKQIVGSSLADEGDRAVENFVAGADAAYYAHLYKEAGLRGGHIILLNSRDSAYYEATKAQALQALAEYPGGLQIGGGIDAANAKQFLDAGASHVIVTSYVFRDGKIDYERLATLRKNVGKEHLVLLGTPRKCYGVGRDITRLEKIIRRVSSTRRIGQLLAPAVDRRTRRFPVAARTVAILEFRHHERFEKIRVIRIRGTECSSLTLLRRNHNGSVRGTRTIEGRCGSSGQDRHRFDILGVQVGNSFRSAARTEFRIAAVAHVIHRNTVDHIKGVGRLRDRLVTAHDNLGGAADTRRRGVDRDTGDLTGQGVDEIGILHIGNGARFHLLHIVAQGFFLTLNTKSSNNHLLDFGSGFFKRNVKYSTAANSHHHRLVAQKINFQLGCCGGGGYLKREGTVCASAGSHSRTFDDDGSSDNRLFVLIQHST